MIFPLVQLLFQYLLNLPLVIIVRYENFFNKHVIRKCLLRNEWAMLHWMCKVKAEDDVSLHDMYSRLSLQPLKSRLRINHLRWYGHVERSEDWIKHCTQINVSGCQGRGRPCKSWKESAADNLCLWNIAPNMVHDRSKWKNALKAAMKSPTCKNCRKVAQSG